MKSHSYPGFVEKQRRYGFFEVLPSSSARFWKPGLWASLGGIWKTVPRKTKLMFLLTLPSVLQNLGKDLTVWSRVSN